MDLGFIKLHRKLMDWEWYTCPNMVQFFIHCLFRAGHKTSKFRGVELEAGQFISGRKTLSLQTGLSEQNVRTCIKNLVLTNEITTKNLGVNTLFTINSWKNYQTKTESNYVPTKEITKCQPSANQVPTTNKKVEECKEVKKKDRAVKKFTPPSIEEISGYIKEKGYSIKAETFFYFYDARDWIVGKVKMKNWKSALSGWASREQKPVAELSTKERIRQLMENDK